MKLRNKETGEIIDGYLKCKYYEDGGYDDMACESLEELFDEWEDYTPAEPLIKNEKVRKVVRWWADYNGDKEVIYFVDGDGSSKLMSYRFEIDFFNEAGELKDGEKYTIDELCGEEEE